MQNSAPGIPVIGIPCCIRSLNDRSFHGVSDRYPDAVIGVSGCLPLLIPASAEGIDPGAILDRLDGLLLTGSPSNVEPHHYGGSASLPGTLHDSARDGTTLPLIREAVRRDMPVLAICRGIQELNVALGGTLHQLVHEVEDRLNHRSRPGTVDEKYAPAHPVYIVPDSMLHRLSGLNEAMVNSLHSQGIDRLAAGLCMEAFAPDGQIEGVSLPKARFVLGLQWHPEYQPRGNPLARAIFEAFGAACRTRRQFHAASHAA